jgi:hypothetical protein
MAVGLILEREAAEIISSSISPSQIIISLATGTEFISAPILPNAILGLSIHEMQDKM